MLSSMVAHAAAAGDPCGRLVRATRAGDRDRARPRSGGWRIPGERRRQAVQQRDLGRAEPVSRVGQGEPRHPVHLRECGPATRPGWPLHLERVRAGRRGPKVSFDRPGVDDLPAQLGDRPQLDRLPVRGSVPGLLLELPPGHGQQPPGERPSPGPGSPLGIVQASSLCAKSGPSGCARSTLCPPPAPRRRPGRAGSRVGGRGCARCGRQQRPTIGSRGRRPQTGGRAVPARSAAAETAAIAERGVAAAGRRPCGRCTRFGNSDRITRD